MGMSVLTKAEDIKAEAVETAIPSADSSEPESPDAPPKRPCVNVSEDVKDDADSNDGWETHSLLEELLNDVTPYTAAGMFLSSSTFEVRTCPNSSLRSGCLHDHRIRDISQTTS